MKKRILRVVFAVFVVTALLCTPAFAEEEGPEWSVRYDPETQEVTYSGVPGYPDGTFEGGSVLYDPNTWDGETYEVDYDGNTGYSRLQVELANGIATVPGGDGGNYNTFGSSNENYGGFPDDYPDFADVINQLNGITRQARAEWINDPEFIKARNTADNYTIKTGKRGASEMSGIIGDRIDPMKPADIGNLNTRRKNNLDTELDNSVTFNLKDGILTIKGNGKNKTVSGGTCYAEFHEPWSHNKYIKTIVIEGRIPNVYVGFDELPNLETVIIMDNATNMGFFGGGECPTPFKDCPNLKNVIYGANLKDNRCESIGKRYQYDDLGNVLYTYDENGNKTPDMKLIVTDLTTHMDNFLKYVTGTSWVLGGKSGADPRHLENAVALTSVYGDWDARVAKAKRIIADANLPESVLAKLPTALGGGAAAGNTPETPIEVPETKPNNINISNWATANVQTATDKGIVPTAALGNDYTKPITRSQFCAIANAVYETKTGTTVTYNGNPFKDVDDSNTAVLKMASQGVVSGYGGGMFGPNDRITREQAATMIARLSAAMGDNLPSKATSFTDKFNTWAIEPVSKVYGAGIMNGYSKTAFGAKDSYTIEQSIVSLLRTFEYGQVVETPDEPVEEENTTPPQPEVPDKPNKPDDNVTETPIEDTHIVELRSNLKMVKGTDKNGRTTITIKDKDDDMGMMPSDIYTLNNDGTVTRVEMRAFEQVGSPKTYDGLIIKDESGNIVFDSKNA